MKNLAITQETPTKGRGWFGLSPANRIKTVQQMSTGDILLKYSPIFEAKNVVKVIKTFRDVAKIPTATFCYWNPSVNQRMGTMEWNEKNTSIINEEYYTICKPVAIL